MTLLELIQILENTNEGSQWLDMDIARAIGWHCPAAEPTPLAQTISDWWSLNWFGPRGSAYGNVRDFPFTTSIDMALTLVPEGMSRGISQFDGTGRWNAIVTSGSGPLAKFYNGWSGQAPLALCSAALQARHYSMKSGS